MDTKINPQDWSFEFQQRGGHPILMADLWCKALSDTYPHEIDLGLSGLDYLMTSENKGYYRTTQREKVLEKFKKRLETDPEYINYIYKKTKQRIEELDAYIKQDSKDWDTFVEKALNMIPWFFIPWYITEYNLFSDKVVSGLKTYEKQVTEITDMNNAAMVLMFPQKQMGFQEEQELFYKLVEEYKKIQTIDATEYLEKFAWMKTFILVPGEHLTKEGLIEKIEKAISEKSDETYALQQKRKEEDKKLITQIEAIISENSELVKAVGQARELAWFLTWSVEEGMKAFSKGIPWYKEIAHTIGVPFANWADLTISEIRESLKIGKSAVTADQIQKRRTAHVFYVVEKTEQLLTGEEAQKLIDTINNTAADDQAVVTEIKGNPACAGNVTGKVRVCLTAQDSHVVEEGDILVCSMTTPDYVPAMKKAGAIVTDEGGLLCHAAIISRELGKPCVIATKNATKILKTGNMVEVNANTGVVTILN